MNETVKEFEEKVKVANEQDILVTALLCIQELLKRRIEKEVE